MVTEIIESIGKWGTKKSPFEPRVNIPHPGDVVEFSEEMVKYPVSHQRCTIVRVENNVVHLIDGINAGHIYENGALSCCGGPFFSISLSDIYSTKELVEVQFWNWGNNLPGYNQSVYFKTERPLFRALKGVIR